jgi:hypothetical protein
LFPSRKTRVEYGKFAVFPQARGINIAAQSVGQFIYRQEEDSWQQD